MWNQLHSDNKGNCEPKRRLVLDHIEFTCGIQIIMVHSIQDMIYGFVKIIEVIDRGKRLCFCSLLHHPQKVNTTGPQMRFSPLALYLSPFWVFSYFLILLTVSDLPFFFFFLLEVVLFFFKPKVLFRIHKNRTHFFKSSKAKKSR